MSRAVANSFGDRTDLRDESVGELFKRLSTDLSLLMRQEFELFRTEMTEKTLRAGRRVGEGAGILSGAAIAGLLALATLTTTIILVLALVMPAWAAALIVTVAYGLTGAILAVMGKRKIAEVTPPIPTQTIETMKEDVEWVKSQTKFVKR